MTAFGIVMLITGFLMGPCVHDKARYSAFWFWGSMVVALAGILFIVLGLRP